ncbi:exodeoxyribonuclease III [Niabella ginsengisoli]|uniref:Exodeoxyribonuclease III n=1 Tax=Niabella ginsengisoli TaxID=522298 RepID=A0ABS9SGP8_9BACT|nr:exodeoxyribonuclease III [Niabella ginsengisoli]MCH5597527.1 exodeoxyribonuclease III [Niabella ginsengisoli]
MKIATYNINGINGRLPVLLKWLKEAKPDIVCLQELKSVQEKFPIKEIERLGYEAVWNGQKSWNGVAILSKGLPMQIVRDRLPGDRKDIHSRYIEVIVAQMLVGNLYLPNGNPAPGEKFDYKMKWFQRLKKHAKYLLSENVPVILAGDYNVIPTELDVYKPERWRTNALFRQEPRRAYKALIAQGWLDAIRHLHPEQRVYTFWDYFYKSYERNASLRLDHFLLSPQLSYRLSAAGVDSHVRGWKKTSDHAPVWLLLDD